MNLNLEEDDFSTKDKGWFPSVSIIRRFHCKYSTMIIMRNVGLTSEYVCLFFIDDFQVCLNKTNDNNHELRKCDSSMSYYCCWEDYCRYQENRNIYFLVCYNIGKK